MRQTILSVVLDVEPQSARRLSGLIEEFKKDQERPGAEWYSELKHGVPSLHFMSMSVFESAIYDPIFVIEANFDGPPGPFWAQMEAAFGIQLRPMLRCCKRPADGDGPIYDAVTKPFSRYPLAPYLEKRTLLPSVFHQGNRGLDRDRILAEGELFLATRTALAQPSPTEPNAYRGITAAEIHRMLRAELIGHFPWLAHPAPPRISWLERLADWGKLVAFAFFALFCLSFPGMALAPMTPAGRYIVGLLIAVVVLAILLAQRRAVVPGGVVPPRWRRLVLPKVSTTTIAAAVLVVAAYLVIASVIGIGIASLMTGLDIGDSLRLSVKVVGLGLLSGVLFIAPVIVLWLRYLERRDSSQDAPPVDERLLGEMARREDWIPQNHMGSVVLVKPGILRTALFRVGHRGLGLLLRILATDGYLGSMRTVHFAHWAFVNNGSRLMFFSNFDHSWESYLDDFIEKAHMGLTLAWGSNVGFPPTRFLVLDGASQGRKFKAWARHSMAVSRFWYSAYRDFTVDQIERNSRIADGLRKETMSEQEAAAWARDL
jgi:hypothetical protein